MAGQRAPTVLGLGRAVVVAGAAFVPRARRLLGCPPLALAVGPGWLVAVGVGMMVQMAGTNTLVQTLVDEDKRGRVMSFYTMAFFGMAPFGSLLAGGLAAGSARR